MSNENDEHQEGSVPVNSEVTPISRQRIKSVNATSWEDMSTADLFEQRSTLQQRLNQAHSMGYLQMAKQIQAGLDQLEAILKTRAGGDTTMHVL